MSYRDDPQWLIALANRDGAQCWYCGIPLARKADMVRCDQSDAYMVPEGMGSPTRDHCTPRSRGGSNKKHNLVLACHRCNCRKANRTVEEYRAALEATERRRVVFAGEVTA